MPPFRTPQPLSPPTRREQNTGCPFSRTPTARRHDSTCCARSDWPRLSRFMSNNSARIRSVDSAGRVHKERQSASDRPVYEVELRPEDGLYPLPYMATQADGAAWEEECGRRNARSPEHPRAKARSARRARATSSQRRLRSTSIACCRRPAIRRVCPRGVDVVQRQRHAQIAPGGKGLDDRIDDPPFRAVEVAGQRSLDSGVVIGDRGLDHDSKASTSGRRRRSPDPRPRPPRLAHRG